MVKQNKTDIKMQKELDYISAMIRNVQYVDYCEYEDHIADLVKTYCPECQKIIDETTIGVFALWANIRNYVRFKSNIVFINQ